jgi:hypothetical protein
MMAEVSDSYNSMLGKIVFVRQTAATTSVRDAPQNGRQINRRANFMLPSVTEYDTSYNRFPRHSVFPGFFRVFAQILFLHLLFTRSGYFSVFLFKSIANYISWVKYYHTISVILGKRHCYSLFDYVAFHECWQHLSF